MPDWVEARASTCKTQALGASLVGKLWELPYWAIIPLVSMRARTVAGPSWARLQCPLACVWVGFGGRPNCARLQYSLMLTRARMDLGLPDWATAPADKCQNWV